AKVREFVDYKDGNLVITDYNKFSGFVKNDLLEHAKQVVTDKSDALAYVDDTSRTTWQKMMEQKGLKIEVPDFSQSELVNAAESRLGSSSQELLNHLGKGGATSVEVVKDAGGLGIMKVNDHIIEVRDNQVVSFDGVPVGVGIDVNADVYKNLNLWQLQQMSVAPEMSKRYLQAAIDLGYVGSNDIVITPQDKVLLDHLSLKTAGLTKDWGIFRQNPALLEFSVKNPTVDLKQLEQLAKISTAEDLKAGLLARNKEALDYTLKHLGDRGFKEMDVARLISAQKATIEQLDVNVPLEKLGQFKDYYEIKPRMSLLGKEGVLIGLPPAAGQSDGHIFLEKGGEVSLYETRNRLLNSGERTSTQVNYQQFFERPQHARQVLNELLLKERMQNQMMAELEIAAKETGLFKMLAIPMDKEYLYKGLDLPATSLASEDSFIAALNKLGEEFKLKKVGQENNFEKMYDIIQQKLVGEASNPNPFAKFWNEHPPLQNETVRHYLGRTVGEDWRLLGDKLEDVPPSGSTEKIDSLREVPVSATEAPLGKLSDVPPSAEAQVFAGGKAVDEMERVGKSRLDQVPPAETGSRTKLEDVPVAEQSSAEGVGVESELASNQDASLKKINLAELSHFKSETPIETKYDYGFDKIEQLNSVEIHPNNVIKGADYLSHELDELKEMEKYAADIEKRYGERPQMDKFVKEVRREIDLTISRLKRFIESAKKPDGLESFTYWRTGYLADASAKFTMERLAVKNELATSLELVKDSMNRMREEMGRK
ncbi:MAG: hypothetical protein NUV82_00155, partial [Candidatus Komeilibacteria bacterium]|nr:hypothetical protein [Candidatus Komeilibacteria bacterium]